MTKSLAGAVALVGVLALGALTIDRPGDDRPGPKKTSPAATSDPAPPQARGLSDDHVSIVPELEEAGARPKAALDPSAALRRDARTSTLEASLREHPEDLDGCEDALAELWLLAPATAERLALEAAANPQAGAGILGAVLLNLDSLSPPLVIRVLLDIAQAQGEAGESQGAVQQRFIAEGARAELLRRLPQVRRKLGAPELSSADRFVIGAAAAEAKRLHDWEGPAAEAFASFVASQTLALRRRDAERALRVLRALRPDVRTPALLEAITNPALDPALAEQAARTLTERPTPELARQLLAKLVETPPASRARRAISAACVACWQAGVLEDAGPLRRELERSVLEAPDPERVLHARALLAALVR